MDIKTFGVASSANRQARKEHGAEYNMVTWLKTFEDGTFGRPLRANPILDGAFCGVPNKAAIKAQIVIWDQEEAKLDQEAAAEAKLMVIVFGEKESAPTPNKDATAILETAGNIQVEPITEDTIIQEESVQDEETAAKSLEPKEEPPTHQGDPLVLPKDPETPVAGRKKSTVASPCFLVWGLADNNPGMRRKDVIALAVEQGVAFYTARTQYQQWKKANAGS